MASPSRWCSRPELLLVGRVRPATPTEFPKLEHRPCHGKGGRQVSVLAHAFAPIVRSRNGAGRKKSREGKSTELEELQSKSYRHLPWPSRCGRRSVPPGSWRR